MSSLTKRVLTAAFSIPIVLGCLYWGGMPFFILVLAASLAAMFELRIMMVEMKMVVSGALLYIGAAGLLTAIYTMDEVLIAPVLLLLFVLAALQELFSESAKPFSRGSMVLLAILYGAFLPGHFLLLRAQPQGLALLFLVLLGTWATDTGAYFIGTRWGRHKLAPVISPNKSVEGAIGGILLAALVTQYVNSRLQIGLLPGWFLGIVIGVAAAVGDLFESALKREAGVKDSGWILPGHGGVLDRIDSLLFTVPVVYYLTRWMG
ncbi:MAG: phosphatidate cytidylyltransferase [Firmicutes bacterium]|jgi:phosphatidate cytidylyltransferase|nr:phosphatidate cytidylyltransferase [Bacillota bacterium]